MSAPPSAASPRSGPVSRATLLALLRSIDPCVQRPIVPALQDLVDLGVAQRQARHFKVDVSFALMADGSEHGRFSVNDKGEPQAFRRRLVEQAGVLGLPEDLAPYLAPAAPGEVQTTLGLKWSGMGGAPARASIYFEELSRSSRPDEIIHAVFRLGTGLPAPPAWPGLVPVSVCMDFAQGEVIASKDYFMETLAQGQPGLDLPPALALHRARLSVHPVNGTRRYLLARRFRPDGALVGHKLLWMTEAHRPDDARAAWLVVDQLREFHALPATATSIALDRLRQRWGHDDDAYLYPDLVSLDTDAQGRVKGLVVYVSVK